jgi:hypothetical protein
MEQFTKFFGILLALVYHCFDRILGHLPLLTRPENIVHFFRDVHGIGTITKEVLRQRTTEYNQWVEAFARNQHIPLEWAEKGVRKEDYVRPRLRQMERQGRFGVYFIIKSMEIGTNFRVALPKYPTADPNYRIPQPPALTLHPLLLLHPGPGAGTDRAVRRLVLAVRDHLLPQW